MFQNTIHKAKMSFSIINSCLTYDPVATILQPKSLNMVIQEIVSAYPSEILDLNDYLLEYHTQLVQHITCVLQDHFIPPGALSYI